MMIFKSLLSHNSDMSDLKLLKHTDLLLQYSNMFFTALYLCSMIQSLIEYLPPIKLHTRLKQSKKQSDTYILLIIDSLDSSKMIDDLTLLLFLVH